MGTKKTSKSSVAIEDIGGRLRLRWRYQGKRYCLSLGLDTTKINLKFARQTASQLEVDMLVGTFDPTLERYGKAPKTPKPALPTTLLELWDMWVETLELSDRTKSGHYETIRRKIIKANPPIAGVAWFVESGYSPKIYNSYLHFLNNCLDWAVSKGFASTNPYRTLKSKRVYKKNLNHLPVLK